MKDASVFDRVAEKLEEHSSFNRLEARGTLRIALKDSGFDAKSVSASQLSVVIERLLPRHLVDRGIQEPEQVCGLLVEFLSSDETARDAADSPEAIFERLGSR